MAPEQAAGDPDIDHRADIYSLGAMAYELLSGQAVFADRTPQRMLAAHMGEAPKPITEFRADLPAALAELVMACLAKDPKDRPQRPRDIARVLETITSGSGMQAMPSVLLGGPGMFRKALAIYAVAFVAVAILAKAAIVGIGLPDWVFPGSLIVMGLGLPVVLWTGYVQRVARRAITMTPTYTPGGSPSMAHGTIATMALKAAPKMRWYRDGARRHVRVRRVHRARFGASWRCARSASGRSATLLASGKSEAREPILLTDFRTTQRRLDARPRRERRGARRTDGLVRVHPRPAGTIAAALARMQQPPTARGRLDGLAREIAVREGIKAIVDGDVTGVSGGYIVVDPTRARRLGHRARLVPRNGRWAARPHRRRRPLARALRGKAGESLRAVNATPALARRRRARWTRSESTARRARANALGRGAVARARGGRNRFHVCLGVELARRMFRTTGHQFAIDSALTQAYRYRDRVQPLERDMMTAAISQRDRA